MSSGFFDSFVSPLLVPSGPFRCVEVVVREQGLFYLVLFVHITRDPQVLVYFLTKNNLISEFIRIYYIVLYG